MIGLLFHRHTSNIPRDSGYYFIEKNGKYTIMLNFDTAWLGHKVGQIIPMVVYDGETWYVEKIDEIISGLNSRLDETKAEFLNKAVSIFDKIDSITEYSFMNGATIHEGHLREWHREVLWDLLSSDSDSEHCSCGSGRAQVIGFKYKHSIKIIEIPDGYIEHNYLFHGYHEAMMAQYEEYERNKKEAKDE